MCVGLESCEMLRDITMCFGVTTHINQQFSDTGTRILQHHHYHHRILLTVALTITITTTTTITIIIGRLVSEAGTRIVQNAEEHNKVATVLLQ
jgi:hypothetical protein